MSYRQLLAVVAMLAMAANARTPFERTLSLGCKPTAVFPASQAYKDIVICDGRYLILDEATGQTRALYLGDAKANGGVASVAVAPDGNKIAISYRDGDVKLWSAMGSELSSWRRPFYVNSLAFAPDAKAIYIDGTPERIEEGALPPDLKPSFDSPNAIAFGPNDVFAALSNTQIERVPLANAARVTSNDELVEPFDLVLSDDGRTLFVAMADGRVVLRNSVTLKSLKTIAGPPDMSANSLIKLRHGRALVLYAPHFGGPDRKVAIISNDGTARPICFAENPIAVVGRNGAAQLFFHSNDGLKIRTIR